MNLHALIADPAIRLMVLSVLFECLVRLNSADTRHKLESRTEDEMRLAHATIALRRYSQVGKAAAKNGGDLEQIKFLLGHSSIQNHRTLSWVGAGH
jgi:hypothetical protein